LTENIKNCPKKRSVDIRAAQGDSGQREVETDGSYNLIVTDEKKVKVKFSHTRYRALGPELIPVYRQSARR